MKVLSSKTYKFNYDKFWFLTKHRIIDDLGYKPPKAEIKSDRYSHEKACADVFSVLARSGYLQVWKAHTKLANCVIPDRTAQIAGEVYHFEIEMGTKRDLDKKLKNYMSYHRTSGQAFHVFFLVTPSQLEYAQGVLDKTPRAYKVMLLSDFLANPFSE